MEHDLYNVRVMLDNGSFRRLHSREQATKNKGKEALPRPFLMQLSGTFLWDDGVCTKKIVCKQQPTAENEPRLTQVNDEDDLQSLISNEHTLKTTLLTSPIRSILPLAAQGFHLLSFST